MSNISPNHDTETLNQNVIPVHEDIHDEDENTETHFSKNSIINISRKAGVK